MGALSAAQRTFFTENGYLVVPSGIPAGSLNAVADLIWESLGMDPQNPRYPDYDNKGFIHWDMDTRKLPTPFSLQGVLALTDTEESQGGFQCVPGHHRILEEWIATQPADRDPYHPDLTGLTVKPIAAKAGDLVIWIRTLAHGNGHNVSGRPRLAQYITMSPARDDEAERQRRLHLYRNQIQMQANRYAGSIDAVESLETPDLTPLGRRLLGVDQWI
jgi:hypothetical protein